MTVLRLALLLLALAAAAPASAQPVEAFYRGRTVTLLVGVVPGGINDISARLVQRHLGAFIPGAPAIVVENMPGGGGVITANHLYNIAARDGSIIAGIERAVPQLAIEGDPRARFDPLKFTWLGSISSYADDAYLLIVAARHPAATVADLDKPGIKTSLGTVRAGSSNLLFALIARDVLGLRVSIVRGYAGAAPMFLAMRSGELDGQVVGLSSILAGQRDMWEKKEVRPLIQFGRATRLGLFPDIPTGRELAKDPDARALIEFAELPFFMSLPFLAPPDVPADRAAALRTAFMAMCRDPDFIADAERLGVDVSPIDAGAIERLLANSAATPKPIITRYSALFRGGGN